jgi:hypothetical protein
MPVAALKPEGWNLEQPEVHALMDKMRGVGTSLGEYVYARLAKYEPEGMIAKVDTAKHDEIDTQVDNKLIASSPFVYIPEYSGIAYQHIWNSIQQEIFVRRFSDIIVETFQKFFVKCEIDPITDYRTFVKKLIELEHINKLSATVSPPNPLFGVIWKELKEYLKSRVEEYRVPLYVDQCSVVC